MDYVGRDMPNHQLTDFGDDAPDHDSGTDSDDVLERVHTPVSEQDLENRPITISADAGGADAEREKPYDLDPNDPESCPWCLATPEAFEELGNGNVVCTNCSSSVPVGAEWYENGEKQGTVEWATELYW